MPYHDKQTTTVVVLTLGGITMNASFATIVRAQAKVLDSCRVDDAGTLAPPISADMPDTSAWHEVSVRHNTRVIGQLLDGAPVDVWTVNGRTI